jgi:hypothetical protein
MQQREISIHSLNVAPETLDGIDAREDGNCAPGNESGCRIFQPRRAGTILRIVQRQQQIETCSNLDQDPKGEDFGREVGKQEARCFKGLLTISKRFINPA